jgi:predicted amidohydrolase
MKIKVAAVQMTAELARIDVNLNKAHELASQAFSKGAEWVILPEFFTTAMGFNRDMINAVSPADGKPMQMLKRLAAEHNGVAGGSFISHRGDDSYNTFVLAFPDGTTFSHDKDQPTMWENCWYVGGKDDGVLDTPAGKVGVAMCWEMIRSRTPRRLLNRVDLVVGGSCWWALPEKSLPGFPRTLDDRNIEILARTPGRLAGMLGVPLIHASHAGPLEGGLPMLPGFPYKSYFLGETQIVDGQGSILARMSRDEGEGFILADVDIGKKIEPSEPVPDRFWIPDLPIQFRLIWAYQNWHGRRYYRKITKPFRKRDFD